MKTIYPDYTKTSLSDVKESFTSNNKKIIDNFLRYCEITASKSSIIKIRGKIIQISDIMEKPLSSLTLKDLREFLAILNNSNRSTDTQNDTKKILKRFLKWKYDDWNVRFKQFEDIKQKRKPTKERLSKEELLTPEDIEELIRKSPEMKFKAMIILLFETAGRPEEIYKLKWKHCNLDNNEIKLGSSKTGDVRTIPIDQSVNRLKLYKQEYPYPNVKAEDYIFPSATRRNKHITTQIVNYYLKAIGKKVLNKRVFPYLIRHTRLNTLRKKLSPDVYQKYAGHSMEVALQHYSHIDNDDVREEMFEKIYNIEEMTKEDKRELQELKKQFEELKKQFKYNFEYNKLLLKIFHKDISQKDAKEKLIKLDERFKKNLGYEILK